MAPLSCFIKHYLQNDLDGEESSKDMVRIAKDLKAAQERYCFQFRKTISIILLD